MKLGWDDTDRGKRNYLERNTEYDVHVDHIGLKKFGPYLIGNIAFERAGVLRDAWLEDSYLVGSDTVLLGEWFSTFRMILEPEDNETSGTTRPTTQRHIPEDLNAHPYSVSITETSLLTLFREMVAH
jgi:hypothetical protein